MRDALCGIGLPLLVALGIAASACGTINSPAARNEVCLIFYRGHDAQMYVRGPNALQPCADWTRALGNSLHAAGDIGSIDMTGRVEDHGNRRLICDYRLGAIEFAVFDTGGAIYGGSFCDAVARAGGR